MRSTLASLAVILCALAKPALADDVPVQGTPDPAVAAFLSELDAGDLDGAASRLTKIGDFKTLRFDPDMAFQANQEEFVAFLSQCRLLEADYRGRALVPWQITQWDCADGVKYHVTFLSEDAHKVAEPVVKSPYLMVAHFETEQMRSDREAARQARFQRRPGAVPPPPPLRMLTQEEQMEAAQERALKRVRDAENRDVFGDAILSEDYQAIAGFITEDTNVRYTSRDPFFNVTIEHMRAKGMRGVEQSIARALDELGQPVAVHCFRDEEPYFAPQVCRWELSEEGKALIAEFHFSGPRGTINSLRFLRETPEEMRVFKQRAVDLGLTDG